MGKVKQKIMAILMCALLACGLFPTDALAYTAYNPIVRIAPANHFELEPIVKVGDSVGGGIVTEIDGATIKVQCTMDGAAGSTNNFRLPYANKLWDISSYKVNYISWAGQGSGQKSEGASAMLSSAGCSAYYYFDYVDSGNDGGSGSDFCYLTLQYDANGGTNVPATETVGPILKDVGSCYFTISEQIPTREGYTFKGWSDHADGSGSLRQPYSPCLVGTISGSDEGYVTKTLYAVWELNETKPTTYTVTYTDGVDEEEIFKDQVTSGLLSGTATPTFKGTPERENYVFKGWSPEVAETVTGNVVYTALWEKNSTSDPSDETTNSEILPPQTGDSSNIILWILLLAFSGFGLTGVLFCSRRKNN